jgi:hypothetical protein
MKNNSLSFEADPNRAQFRLPPTANSIVLPVLDVHRHPLSKLSYVKNFKRVCRGGREKPSWRGFNGLRGVMCDYFRW